MASISGNRRANILKSQYDKSLTSSSRSILSLSVRDLVDTSRRTVEGANARWSATTVKATSLGVRHLASRPLQARATVEWAAGNTSASCVARSVGFLTRPRSRSRHTRSTARSVTSYVHRRTAGEPTRPRIPNVGRGCSTPRMPACSIHASRAHQASLRARSPGSARSAASTPSATIRRHSRGRRAMTASGEAGKASGGGSAVRAAAGRAASAFRRRFAMPH